MDAIREFVYTHFEHVLFGLLLVSRVGDVISTYLATPKLKLEANPIVRRLKWPFAVITILVSLIAYVNTAAAVILLVPFLLVSASNFSKVWLMRGMGEDAYMEMLLCNARRTRLRHAIAGVLASAFFIALAGCVLLILIPTRSWGFPFGLGIILYAVIQALYGSLSSARIFKAARLQSATM